MAYAAYRKNHGLHVLLVPTIIDTAKIVSWPLHKWQCVYIQITRHGKLTITHNHKIFPTENYSQTQQAVHVATQYAPPLSSPCGRPSVSRAAEQTQRSATFPSRIRSHADRCSRLIVLRPRWVKQPGALTFWPWNWGYLCANFRLPRHLCSRVRPDVCDRQTDVRQKHHLMPHLLGAGHKKWLLRTSTHNA